MIMGMDGRSRRAERTIADSRQIGELLRRARKQPLSDDAKLTAKRAAELVASIREDRDRR
jgi:hypothetical protein